MRGVLAGLFALLTFSIAPAMAETVLKVGWAAPVISAAAAPFAVAQRMGWFEQAGIKVQIIAMPGSTGCAPPSTPALGA